MSESTDSSDLSITTEQDGGSIMNDMFSLGSIISSCTLCILFIIMTFVLADKSYCAH